MRFRFLLLALVGAALIFGQPVNAPEQQDKPYVLLVSLDGFRYDFATKYGAKTLVRFGERGVAAKALIPSYPSSTFPNHYSIVTGLYPEHHGIVENSFYDPARGQLFKFSDPATASDGSWYGGTPLWVLAEQQGMLTAPYFWPGADAGIQNTRPTYSYKYDGAVPNAQRIAQVVAWLKLPKTQRPHFITLYFSEVDHQGHTFGPDSPEEQKAVADVDHAIAGLLESLKLIGVPIDVLIVSDHGMLAVEGKVNVRMLAPLQAFHLASGASQVMLYSKDQALIDATYTALKDKDSRINVYRRSETPGHLHYRDSNRIGDLVIEAAAPVLVIAPPPDARPRPSVKGMHGYDPQRFPEMRGIFLAQGPDLKTGVTLEPFENIHIYPLIAHILGLKTPAVDGSLSVLAPILSGKAAVKHATP
jgi:predicted AlkP superfamily pyrophosphatase or phosphodiesterase